MAKQPPPHTSAIASSLEEVLSALEGERPLAFPVIAIPWGAETTGSECRLFQSIDEIDRDTIERLQADAFPFKGKRRIHLLSMKSGLISQPWGKLIPGPTFRLQEQ